MAFKVTVARDFQSLLSFMISRNKDPWLTPSIIFAFAKIFLKSLCIGAVGDSANLASALAETVLAETTLSRHQRCQVLCEDNISTVRDSTKLSLQRQCEVGISVVLTTLMPTLFCLWQRWCHVSGFRVPFPLETAAYSTHTHTQKKELTENRNFHLFAANRKWKWQTSIFWCKLKM